MSIEGDLTKAGQRSSSGNFIQCNGRKWVILSDDTKAAVGLIKFFEDLERILLKEKNLAKNAMKNLRRA